MRKPAGITNAQAKARVAKALTSYRRTPLTPAAPGDEDRLRFDTTGAEDRRRVDDDLHGGEDRWRERAAAGRRERSKRRVNVRVSPPRWNPDADGVLGYVRERDAQLARIRAIREIVRAREAPIFAEDVEALARVPITRRHPSRLDCEAGMSRYFSWLEAGTLVALIMDGAPEDDCLGPEVAAAADEVERVGLTIRNVHAKGHGGDRVQVDPDELRERRRRVGLGVRELAREAAALLPERTADSVYAQLQRIEAGKASSLHLDTVWAISAVLVEAETEAAGSLAVLGGRRGIYDPYDSSFPTSSVGIGSLALPTEVVSSRNYFRRKSEDHPETLIAGDAANERRSWSAHRDLVQEAKAGGRWYRPAGVA
jgi:hypothetical protein